MLLENIGSLEKNDGEMGEKMFPSMMYHGPPGQHLVLRANESSKSQMDF
jgi:hypothetical protein